MKIQGYRSILEQLLRLENRPKDIQAKVARTASGEKTEISDAVDILQRELERTEREADMARAARLESIAEKMCIRDREQGVDVVIESTGRFRSREAAAAHLRAGAKKVIITAPGDKVDLTVVLGVNEGDYRHEDHHIVSNASCTTNALAPVVKVLHENFGIKKGLMNTTHAFTNDQVLLDFPNKDLRRARSAPLSIIPTSTGAAKAVGLVMPELNGLLNGFALRVPTATVSVVDFVVELNKEVTAEEINDAFMKAAGQTMALAYSDEPLVSMDFKGNPYSSTVDGLSTMVVGGNLARVVTWYDNEWAYSCRIGDLIAYMGQFF